MTGHLVDSFNRKFEYLRLSITDVCNFKCQYCLPNGFKQTNFESFLSIKEIERLVSAFSELGMWKIRLTGGEPTLRRDFLDIVTTIKSNPNIKKIVFSTNGFKLYQCAKSFYEAGIRGVNVSVDTLDAHDFYKITGQNILPKIIEGIECALDIGYESVKINAVLLNSFNDNKLDSFIEFVQHRNISVRFIELMKTNENIDYFKQNHVSANFIKDRLIKLGFKQRQKELGAGPAEIWGHDEFTGTIGLIAPYSKDFCTTCNRLRINARGLLRLCLFGTGGFDLRKYLTHDDQKEELKSVILAALKIKKESHFLNDGNSGDTPHLASIGG